MGVIDGGPILSNQSISPKISIDIEAATDLHTKWTKDFPVTMSLFGEREPIDMGSGPKYKLLNTMSIGELQRLTSGGYVRIRHPKTGELNTFKCEKGLYAGRNTGKGGSSKGIYFLMVETRDGFGVYMRKPGFSSVIWNNEKEIINAVRKRAYEIITTKK